MSRTTIVLALTIAFVPSLANTRTVDRRFEAAQALGSASANLAALSESQNAYRRASGELAGASLRLSAAVAAVMACQAKATPPSCEALAAVENARVAFEAEAARLKCEMQSEAGHMENLTKATKSSHDVAMNAVRNIRS